MPYCTECGEEVTDGTSFCPNCGTAVEKSDEDSIDETNIDTDSESGWGSDDESTETPELDSEGVQWKLLGVSGIMSFVVGFQVLFAFSEFGGGTGSILFFVTLAGVTGFLYNRTDSIKESFATGLYIVAAWFILAPLMFYVGVAGQSANEFAAVGAVFGMVIFGFIGLLLAIVTAGIGYFVNSRYVS